MTAPRLETFYSGTRIQETGYSIYKFMQRSSPPLTMLHLVRSVDEETLINILALLPTLKDLHLAEFVVSSRLFDALTVFEDSTTARVVGAAYNAQDFVFILASLDDTLESTPPRVYRDHVFALHQALQGSSLILLRDRRYELLFDWQWH